MNRNVFISFLGSNNYSPCIYTEGDKKSESVRFIQETVLLNIGAKSWKTTDKAYIMVTEGERGSRVKNWEDDGQTQYQSTEKIVQPGLKTTLTKLQLPFEVEAISVKDGNTEAEIWDIFKSVFDLLQPEDELYIDITHGYRFMPMFMLVLANYSKFLKKVNVQYISYGNYEARNAKNEAPIINLKLFSDLQDWTTAIKDFTDYGKTSRLCTIIDASKDELSKKESGRLNMFSNNLKLLEGAFYSVRGKTINEGKILKDIKDALPLIGRGTAIKPLEPMLDVIADKISDFSSENDLWNGIKAARWCFNNQLIQQAYTIGQESIISIVCDHFSMNYKKKNDREIISGAISIYNQFAAGKITTDNLREPRNKYLELFNEPVIQQLSLPFSQLTGLRNSMNHGGTTASHSYEDFKTQFTYFDTCVEILNLHINPTPCS